MIKCLRFVRRAAAVPADDFGRRWRDEAAGCLDTMPAHARPRRLAHCVVRHGQPEHDGVAISWHDDADALAAYDEWATHHGIEDSALDVDASSVVRVEERTVFGRAWLDERWRAGAGQPHLLLIGLIEAAEGMSREDFRDYWWSRHRPLAHRLIPPALQPLAYVHDYVLPDETTRWAGIGELYEESLDVARRRGAWFDSDAATELVADEERFLVPATRQLLVTDHHVITSEGVLA